MNENLQPKKTRRTTTPAPVNTTLLPGDYSSDPRFSGRNALPDYVPSDAVAFIASTEGKEKTPEKIASTLNKLKVILKIHPLEWHLVPVKEIWNLFGGISFSWLCFTLVFEPSYNL